MQNGSWSTRGLAVAIASSLTIVSVSKASLLLYDGFNYAAGTNVPDSGATLNGGTSGSGTSWSSGWVDGQTDAGANAYTLTSGGLSYTTPQNHSLTVVGNALNRGNDNIGAQRTFTAQPDGTYYVSFLMSVGADPANTYAGLAIANRAYLGLTKVGTVSQFVAGNGYAGGSPVSTGIQVSPNTTYLLLGRIDFSTTANDTIGLWVNPVVSAEGNAGAADAVYQHTLGTFNSFGGVYVYQSTAAYNLTVDEFRLGTTWADVTPGLPVAIPEPAGIGLLALAGLCTLRTRRA